MAVFAGREVAIRPPLPFQLQALRRFYKQMQARVAQVDDETDEGRKDARAMIIEFNEVCLDLVDSLIIEDVDKEWLLRAQIRGELDPSELSNLLFGVTRAEDEPDDEPVVSETPKKAVATRSARVASAKRTQRK
jgi:hypothetical protein